MQRILILATLSFLFIQTAFSQMPVMKLSFSAARNTQYLPIDSVKVINRTQECDTMLVWPDTVLYLDYQVGLSELLSQQSEMKCYPNPAIGYTRFGLEMESYDQLTIRVSELSGRIVLTKSYKLEKGYHNFRLYTGKPGVFTITAAYSGRSLSTKLISTSHQSERLPVLEYSGKLVAEPVIKSINSSQSFDYTTGDKLLVIGYVDGIESGFIDSPRDDKEYQIQFGTNIPCPGLSSFTYGGQEYHTIQILGQCWMKENLNIGTLIPGSQSQSHNAIIEKYCHSDSPDSCAIYGGLYQWEEMMKYLVTGYQGICPEGWHVPIDEDWKVLEGAVDSHIAIGSPVWDAINYRGVDAGAELKSEQHWLEGGTGSDGYGFTGLPGGYMVQGGAFGATGYDGIWWSSPVPGTSRAWVSSLSAVSEQSGRNNYDKSNAFSVRCLKDQ